jgi:glycine/D-amino acid oxidase-like deaminating enzyme
VRACIVGGGLAGVLLAWRLARAESTTDWQLDLLAGGPGRLGASDASGGAVRGFEGESRQRRLAVESLAELLGSPVLRAGSGYRETGAVNLLPAGQDTAAALAGIEAGLPGSARLSGAADLARAGWSGLPDDCVAVVEQQAGYLSATGLRETVLSDPAVRRRVRVLPADLDAVGPQDDGSLLCTVAGEPRHYDLVVLATGPWTPSLLRGSGLPAAGSAYRTKSIQFVVREVEDFRPPHFVDHLTGLYGRPEGDHELLLGVPTDDWDVDPDRPQTSAGLADRAAELARSRFPRLRLGRIVRHVGATDCYTTDPILDLRPVLNGEHRLFTFSGGSGGAAKTALAASRLAAGVLTEARAESIVAT